MLTPIHEELVEGLAAATLSAPMRLLAQTYADTNDAARTALLDLDIMGGDMLESCAPSIMSDTALETALALIESLENDAGEAKGLGETAPRKAALQADQMFSDLMALPATLRDQALESGADWRFAAPGVRRMTVLSDENSTAELLRIEPGHGSPSHTHEGRETTLVLSGAFHDGHTRYGKGDVCDAGPDITHRPIAEAGEVCYALAVTQGGLKFKGPLGLAQRLMGG